MYLDFVLKKDDFGNKIIFKLKLSQSSTFYKFKDGENQVSFHSRLNLLNRSNEYFTNMRSIKNKFIEKEVLKYYYDDQEQKFFFNGYFLFEFDDNQQHDQHNQNINQNEDKNIKILNTLKFNSKYNNCDYFLYLFKKNSTGLTENIKKYYFKKFIEREDIEKFINYEQMSINQIYEMFYLTYYERSSEFRNEMNNLRIENCESLEDYAKKKLEYLDKIFLDVTLKRKIKLIIGTFPEQLKIAFDSEFIDKQVLTNKRKFLKFVKSHSNSNGINSFFL